jgi:AmiR/NasT family two-component response regulator
VQRDTDARRNILVVDDDRLGLATLSEGLRLAGYRVAGAASAYDALLIAKNEGPDLALLHVRVSGMDGIELSRQLRDQAGVRSLYLSTDRNQDMVKRAAAEGALGYLVKPVEIEQIVPSIEIALARAREIRDLRKIEEQLNTALAGSREISMAVGLLMMHDHLGCDQAFEFLRGHARSQRRTVRELALELLKSAETLNVFRRMPSGARWTTR